MFSKTKIIFDMKESPEASKGLLLSLFSQLDEFMRTGSAKSLNFFWRGRLSKQERKILADSFHLLVEKGRKEGILKITEDFPTSSSIKELKSKVKELPLARQILKNLGFIDKIESSVRSQIPVNRLSPGPMVDNLESIQEGVDTIGKDQARDIPSPETLAKRLLRKYSEQ
jgi:hypothetical protein